jgi:hypothetical protein
MMNSPNLLHKSSSLTTITLIILQWIRQWRIVSFTLDYKKNCCLTLILTASKPYPKPRLRAEKSPYNTITPASPVGKDDLKSSFKKRDFCLKSHQKHIENDVFMGNILRGIFEENVYSIYYP